MFYIVLHIYNLLHQPLYKIRPDYPKRRRPHIQKKAVKFQLGVICAKCLSGLPFHGEDFQITGIIGKVIGGILHYFIIDRGYHIRVCDLKVKNYFGKFNPSAMRGTLQCIERRLIKWTMCKYKRTRLGGR